MELLLKKIALIIASLSALIGITPKFGAIIQEVPMYYEDKNDMECFKAESSSPGAIGCRPKLKVRELKENEFYKTGSHDAGSTTPQIRIKQSGIETTKYLNEISLSE